MRIFGECMKIDFGECMKIDAFDRSQPLKQPDAPKSPAH